MGLPYVDRVVPTQFVVLDTLVLRKLVIHELFGFLGIFVLLLELKNLLRVLIAQGLLLGELLILEVRDIRQALQLRDQHLSLCHTSLVLVGLGLLGLCRQLLLLSKELLLLQCLVVLICHVRVLLL